jgi:hypothetical protein
MTLLRLWAAWALLWLSGAIVRMVRRMVPVNSEERTTR